MLQSKCLLFFFSFVEDEVRWGTVKSAKENCVADKKRRDFFKKLRFRRKKGVGAQVF